MYDGLFDYRRCRVNQNDIASLDLGSCQVTDESVSSCNTFADEYVDFFDEVSLRLILRS